MSGGWIKFEKDLLTDPRVTRMSNLICQPPCNAQAFHAVTLVLGGLAKLWMLADTHVSQDDILPLGVDEINEFIGLKGFCEILPQDWLQVIDANNVKFPNYHVHNGTEAKKKAQTQKRVKNHRNKHKLVRNAQALQPVTHAALPDQDLFSSLTLDNPKSKNLRKETPIPPLGLDLSAWDKWFGYRAAIKKPIRPPSIAAAMAELVTHGQAQSAVVQHSIANSYQGLFAPKTNGKTGAAKLDDSAEWSELRAHGAAIGFRAPMVLESIGAYRTDLRMFESVPGNRRPDALERFAALTAKLTHQ